MAATQKHTLINPKKGKKRATFDLVLEPEKQGEGKARDALGR